jgi:prepilin-type N-terminal cleavage/methylation domain-containing protein
MLGNYLMMQGRRTLHRGRAAFTLIEMLISVTVFAFVLGVMALVQQRSQATSRATFGKTISEMRARHALDRVVTELTGAAHSLISRIPPRTWARAR